MIRSARLIRQLISFSVVGLSSNLVGYAVYLVLAETSLGSKLAVAILYPIGVVISYIANKRLTFRHDKGQVFSSAVRYLMVCIFGYFLNLLLIIWFVEILGFPHQIVQIMAIFLVALSSFVLLRMFVFGRS